MIVKELKHIIFTWDENDKTLLFTPVPLGYGVNQITLSRVEMFSLSRFIIRVAQKPVKKKLKSKTKGGI